MAFGVGGPPTQLDKMLEERERLRKENAKLRAEIDKTRNISSSGSVETSANVNGKLPHDSVCASALDFALYAPLLERKNLNMTQSRIFTRSDPPEDYVKASPKLSFINAGAGGTGTSVIYEVMCNLYQLLSWHSPWHCGSRKLDDVAILFGQVHGFGVRNNAMVTRTSRIKAEAVLRNRQAGKMQSKDVKLLLNRYYKERLMELSQGFFVTDTPVAEVFHELLLLAKEQAGVMMTLREASEWTERRIAQFSNTWMCRRELWDDPNVLHPFDYLGCFIAAKHGFSPNKAFTSMIDHAVGAPPLKYVGLPVTEKLKERFNSTLIKEIEQAYVQMNTVNWLLAQKMGKPVMPVCLWDRPFNKAQSKKPYMARQREIQELLIQPFLDQNKIKIMPGDRRPSKSLNQYPHGKPKER